jgi:hypothetical protein
VVLTINAHLRAWSLCPVRRHFSDVTLKVSVQKFYSFHLEKRAKVSAWKASRATIKKLESNVKIGVSRCAVMVGAKPVSLVEFWTWVTLRRFSSMVCWSWVGLDKLAALFLLARGAANIPNAHGCRARITARTRARRICITRRGLYQVISSLANFSHVLWSTIKHGNHPRLDSYQFNRCEYEH